jgi:hypothetical protein
VEHVVFFPTRDGGASFRRVPSFEEAVRLVEHLRNVEGVEQVSVHSLTEVPLNFRAYYRVEVAASASEAHAAPPAAQAPAPEMPSVASIGLEPAGEPLTVVAAAVAPEPVSAPALALVESVPVQATGPDAEAAASNGRGRDSGTSLGFFA